MINQLGDASLWASFGLPGLVIFALFIILLGVVIFAIKRFDRIDERNIKHANDMADRHKEERNEWRVTTYSHLDKLDSTMTRLADGIRDSRE